MGWWRSWTLRCPRSERATALPAPSQPTTVSAVIFLYGPSTKLAAVAIVHMDEAGTTAAAAAMASVIMATALGARLALALINRFMLARVQGWRRREGIT